jgi:hypothetical protein
MMVAGAGAGVRWLGEWLDATEEKQASFHRRPLPGSKQLRCAKSRSARRLRASKAGGGRDRRVRVAYSGVGTDPGPGVRTRVKRRTQKN